MLSAYERLCCCSSCGRCVGIRCGYVAFSLACAVVAVVVDDDVVVDGCAYDDFDVFVAGFVIVDVVVAGFVGGDVVVAGFDDGYLVCVTKVCSSRI